MRALSIRQPWAELILRGVKRIEYRTVPTRIIGERFWIYASKGKATKRRSDEATKGGQIWSSDLVTANDNPPPRWMVELANALRLFPRELPTGVIVGSAVIERCLFKGQAARGERQGTDSAAAEASSPLAPGRSSLGIYEWHLTGVERVANPRKPKRHPQPVWFKPF